MTERKQIEQQVRGLAADGYAGHQLMEEEHTDGGRHFWLIRNPDTGFHWAEIAVVRGCVLVHGDLPSVMFKGHSGPLTSVLEWIALSELDYISQKATGVERLVFDMQLALSDLKEHSVLDDLQLTARYGLATEQDLYQQLNERGLAQFSDVGRHINPDIIWAQEAVRTLLRLKPKPFGDER